MLCLYIIWLVCNLQGVPSSSGPKREWRMIDQSDGDELYEVLNAQTQRFVETNSNPVIIGTLHGPYASFLIGQVSYHKNGESEWLMQRLKGHQVWSQLLVLLCDLTMNKSLRNN
jgi:hypothetical protein